MSETIGMPADRLYEDYLKCVKNLSRDRWAQQTSRPDIDYRELSENESSRLVKNHQSAHILLAGKGVRIEFRAYFSDLAIENIIAESLNKPKNMVSRALLHDAMREFCNLVAGGIKSSFNKKYSFQMGLSIPLISRSFDEIWFDDDRGVHRDLWVIHWSKESFIVSISSLFADMSILSEFGDKTDPIQLSEEDGDGGLELL